VTAKLTDAPCRPVPQEFCSVAWTVAGEPTVWVWVGGVSASVEPTHGWLPAEVHWVD
jgi:hypothetical protein